MVYVAESKKYDMHSAIDESICFIHLAENEHFPLEMYSIKINTLKKLEYSTYSRKKSNQTVSGYQKQENHQRRLLQSSKYVLVDGEHVAAVST